jgi:membrane protein implicated in regulation of membrane protease activity
VSLRTILRSAWRDSVWSKVIATGITAALGAGAAAVFSYWHSLETRAAGALTILDEEMLVPVWLVAALALVAVVLAVASMFLWAWAERAARETEQEVQPNALLVEEAKFVEASRLGQPFEALSDEQRSFLRSVYRRGDRGFEMPNAQTGFPWFEMLEHNGYVRAVGGPVVFTGSTPYEITEAAWLELEKVFQ